MTLEDDDDAGARRLHPGLQVSDLDLQLGEFGLIRVVARLLRSGGAGFRRFGGLVILLLIFFLMVSSRVVSLEGAKRVVEIVEDPGR